MSDSLPNADAIVAAIQASAQVTTTALTNLSVQVGAVGAKMDAQVLAQHSQDTKLQLLEQRVAAVEVDRARRNEALEKWQEATGKELEAQGKQMSVWQGWSGAGILLLGVLLALLKFWH